MSTRLVLVRHGRVEGIDPPRFRGRADLPLTKAGLREAAATRDYLRRLAGADALYTSPLQRCLRTAAIIGEPRKLVPRVAPELNDIDYGHWQGVTYAELEQRDPTTFATWLTRPDRVTIPGGESLAALGLRATGFLEQVALRHAGGAAILVAHTSVNRVLLLHALDLPLSMFWRLGQDPCAVNLLFHEHDQWTVHSLNETAHLYSP